MSSCCVKSANKCSLIFIVLSSIHLCPANASSQSTLLCDTYCRMHEILLSHFVVACLAYSTSAHSTTVTLASHHTPYIHVSYFPQAVRLTNEWLRITVKNRNMNGEYEHAIVYDSHFGKLSCKLTIILMLSNGSAVLM